MPKISKVVYGNDVLIDLTADTVDAAHLLSGYKAHAADGEQVTGACTYDADTKDATAAIAEVLSGRTFYKNGSKLTGTMPNVGSQTIGITDKTTPVAISQGYHDGGGSAGIAAAEAAKLIPANIRENITVLGVTGTMSGSEGMHPKALSVTPYTTAKQYSPSGDHNCYSQVTVAAIAYQTTENTAGGLTVTIGTVAPN